MAPVSYIDISAAIKAAEEAIAEKYEALEKVAVMRETLRSAVKMKVQMTKEQREWIEGTFPIHERKKGKKGEDATPEPAAQAQAA
jgi:hypothetical protein